MTAGHKLAVVARQESNHVCNIIRASKAAKGSLIFQLLQSLFTPTLLVVRSRIDDGSVNSVDTDVILAELFRSRECNATECESARRVRD